MTQIKFNKKSQTYVYAEVGITSEIGTKVKDNAAGDLVHNAISRKTKMDAKCLTDID